eukprot:Cvel_36607.t1-p1 / transcript=Cvel_36607.t1 / gene=Cvel_36607 / organism=Chromera_velia_CCMP2878 / gene_product=hypothetical protein / transcript_product=hypothetical protein / location=Cvel_scaffold7517:1-760(-) / protein_length=253 / sequence_SO=supercontig / SO=protein_coding / is_pseudo=false
MVKWFLEKGADPNKHHQGYTCFHVTATPPKRAQTVQIKIVRLLKQFGGNPNVARTNPHPFFNGETPLMRALGNEKYKLAEELVRLGATVGEPPYPPPADILANLRRLEAEVRGTEGSQPSGHAAFRISTGLADSETDQERPRQRQRVNPPTQPAQRHPQGRQTQSNGDSSRAQSSAPVDPLHPQPSASSSSSSSSSFSSSSSARNAHPLQDIDEGGQGLGENVRGQKRTRGHVAAAAPAATVRGSAEHQYTGE